MEKSTSDFIQEILKSVGERPVISIFGPWYPTFDDDRKLISDELKKSEVQTIRLSEHTDLYTREDLTLTDIEEQRQIAAEAYEEAVRMWENPPATIVMIGIAPMPESSHTPDSPVQ